MEILRALNYRDYKIDIMCDEDPPSPSEYDEAAQLYAWSPRNLWIPVKEAGSNTPQGWIAHFKKTHWVYLVEAYIHSGVVLAPIGEGSFPDREWDVTSPIGMVVLDKEIWRTRNSKKAYRAMRSVIDTWNMYLSGEVYAYTISSDDGALVGQCAGIYGEDECVREAKDEIDAYINNSGGSDDT